MIISPFQRPNWWNLVVNIILINRILELHYHYPKLNIIVIFVIILSFIFLDNLKPSYFYLIYYLLNYYLMSFLLYLSDITYYYYFSPIYAISDYSSYCFLLSYFHHIFSKFYSYPVNYYYLSLPTLV